MQGNGKAGKAGVYLAAAFVGWASATGAALAHDAGFDGKWTIHVKTDSGFCVNGLSFPVRVNAGTITYAGFFTVEAPHAISRRGRVELHLVQGGNDLISAGALHARSGGGRWFLRSFPCAGRWRAEKQPAP
jgi:hypothetical protein